MAIINQQYVLLPKGTIFESSSAARAELQSLPSLKSTDVPLEASLSSVDSRLTVIDSVSEDGVRLVEMSPEAADRTNRGASALRAVPLVHYSLVRPVRNLTVGVAGAATVVRIRCKNASSGHGVEGAQVVAFTDFGQRVGAEGQTDAAGDLSLALNSNALDRVYVYPPAGYWGAFRQSISATGIVEIEMDPVDLTIDDAIRMRYPMRRFDSGVGVRVGVVDTGCGPHPDLNITLGRNTVTGEAAADFSDSDSHGTHVAGLIGANGSLPTGLQGMAPGVELAAYRVFGNKNPYATNYAIVKALILAQADGCDIVNLSLGGGPAEDIVGEAIVDARNRGMLVVAAAGNDGRRPVSYPAAYSEAVAVSSMGIEGAFPRGSLDEGEISRPPFGTDPSEFLAGFSNVGPEIDVTGLGVGVLSTLPGGTYGPMSGTSMAAPFVAGAVASLLSQNLSIHAMNRDHTRSDAMRNLLTANSTRRGFALSEDGQGLIDPTVV